MRKRFVQLVEFLTYGAGILLLILVVLFGSVRIQEWIFRHRAERLLSDIQSIDSRHATFQQVGSVFDRWHGFISYGMPCSKENCDFGITISEPMKWRDNSKVIPALLDFYRWLGGHPAIVRATIKVRNGFVWAKRYSLAIEAPPVVDSDGRSLTYYVEGNISTEPRDETYSPVRPSTGRQAEYQIGSNACLGCLEIHVSFTPAADSADVRRLSHINFSCLTRQHPCRTKEDIMPTAASEQERLSSAPT